MSKVDPFGLLEHEDWEDCTNTLFVRLVQLANGSMACRSTLHADLMACCKDHLDQDVPSIPQEFNKCVMDATTTYRNCAARSPGPVPVTPAPGTPTLPVPRCITLCVDYNDERQECYACCYTRCQTYDVEDCKRACDQNLPVDLLPISNPRKRPGTLPRPDFEDPLPEMPEE